MKVSLAISLQDSIHVARNNMNEKTDETVDSIKHMSAEETGDQLQHTFDATKANASEAVDLIEDDNEETRDESDGIIDSSKDKVVDTKDGIKDTLRNTKDATKEKAER